MFFWGNGETGMVVVKRATPFTSTVPDSALSSLRTLPDDSDHTGLKWLRRSTSLITTSIPSSMSISSTFRTYAPGPTWKAVSTLVMAWTGLTTMSPSAGHTVLGSIRSSWVQSWGGELLVWFWGLGREERIASTPFTRGPLSETCRWGLILSEFDSWLQDPWSKRTYRSNVEPIVERGGALAPTFGFENLEAGRLLGMGGNSVIMANNRLGLL